MKTILRTLRQLARAKDALVLGLAAAVFLAIAAFESVAPLNVVGAYAFVIPILLVATVRNRKLMYVTVVLCIAVTYIGLLQPTKKRERFTAVLINRTLVVGILAGVAYFAMTREERKAREEAARAELLRANTQLVELKDRLNRSDRLAALGLLASSVAHEVGTPLHSVAWQVQTLAEDPQTTPEMKKTIAIIDSELNRVVRIIKEKLSLTRQPKPAHAPVRVDQLAQSVVALMEPAYLGKGVGLKTDLGLEPAVVQGDVEQLRQVLVNLLTNALAATGPGGQVVLVVGRRAATLAELDERRRMGEPPCDAMVTLTVRDTGCGMPEEHVKQAFEPFFTTKAIGDGTGLGLFISREIVASHGGSLAIESVVGKGTLIVIALPGYVSEQAATEQSTHEHV
ncbi:MAG TPA: ATP-binding protein [Nitrospiraceae bacterium]|nr:ATP-binding protein [Nitrospiraceae bacterium]